MWFSLCLAWLQMKGSKKPARGRGLSPFLQKFEGWKF